MKYIQKSKVPTCLTEYKKQADASFKELDSDCKQEIRRTLLDEQGYICAYCMQPISEDWNKKLSKYKVEIEHFKSQYRHPTLTLDYNNMLAVCNGNADKSSHGKICDKAKSKFDKTHDLFVNPLIANREQQIHYTFDGKIISTDKRINDDLEDLLNLNERNLKKEREKLYRKTKKKIRSFWAKPKATKATVKKDVEELKKFWEKRYDGRYLPPLPRPPLPHRKRIEKIIKPL